MLEALGQLIAEAVVWVTGLAIYGTPDDPRPAILRNSLRLVTLGGLLVAFAAVLGHGLAVPKALIWGWMLVSTIVVLSEYRLGSRPLALAAWGAFGLLAILGVLH